MEVKYSLVYHPAVVRSDLPKLSAAWKSRIRKALEERLMTAPLYYGIPLRGTLKGYFKLRVGDYRIVFTIQKLEVSIYLIMHRSGVYRIASRRLRD